MADFEAQVNGLTDLSIGSSSTSPSRDELSQFLKDGVLEVTNRTIALKSQDAFMFVRSSSEGTSQGALSSDSGKVLTVVREAGVNNDWRDCRFIPLGLQSNVTDTDSLHFTSKYNPSYTIEDDGKVNVYPTPSSDPDAYKIYFINGTPVDNSGAALAQGASTIKYFPDDKVYLVVLYASIQSLMSKLTSLNSSLPSDITLPAIPVVPSMNATTVSIPSFTAPNSFVQPVAPAGADIDFSDVPTAPTYIPTVLTLGTTPTISDLTISAVAPVPPPQPSFSTPTISAVTVGTMPDIDTTILSNIGTPPTYTSPTVGGATEELTASMTAVADDAIGTDVDFRDFSKWFTAVGELIEDEEDVELAQAQLQKISTYVQAYSVATQNQLNVFNNANVEYQAKLQEGIQQAQINAQKATQQAQIDASKVTTQAQLDATDAQQEASLLLQKENQEYGDSLQRFTAEVQVYQADVAKEVQEYQQNLASDLQVWQAERTTDLQKYGSDIQNETSRVTNDIKIYQQEITKASQKYQAETGYDLGKYTAEVQAATAKFTNDLQKNNTTFQSDLAKFNTDLKETQQENREKLDIYNADVQKYNADLAGKVQEFTTSLQKDQAGYQWVAAQYASLKAQYDGAFARMAPPAPQQQQQRAAQRRR
jgi:hypothetical protein